MSDERSESETVTDSIIRHEGFSSHCYLDTQGYLSLGYGTTVGRVSPSIEALIRKRSPNHQLRASGVGVTKKQARGLVVDRVARLRERLARLCDGVNSPQWWELTKYRRDVLVQMSYQLGIAGTLNFRKMWRAMSKEDWEAAADEMLDSRWAKQTAGRAEELAGIMRRGEL